MTTLTFPRAGVERLLEILKGATKFRPNYGDDGPPKPGLWLVGDDGIYLMANAVLDNDDKPFVVDSKECNAKVMEFNDWWANKQTIWGGDDGVETLDLKDVQMALLTYQPGEDFKIDMTPKTFAIVYYRPKTKPAAPKAKAKRGRS